jgi:DNA-binding XRE family transcriptional regulator
MAAASWRDRTPGSGWAAASWFGHRYSIRNASQIVDSSWVQGPTIITAGQLRASRALLGIDQRKLAELAGLSLPTIQRMEGSDGVIRGNLDSLMKLVAALDGA